MFKCRSFPAEDKQVLVIRKFIYQAYAIDLHWIPPAKNPSQWTVVDRDRSEPYFVDFYDSHADWFALYTKDKDELIGCCRTIKPKEGRLEVELYHSIPSEYKKASAPAEMNRFALKKEYLASNAPLILFLAVVEHALSKNIDALFIATPVTIADFCVKIGFRRIEGAVFKYFPSDPLDTSLLVLDLKDKALMEGIIRQCRTMHL